MIIFMFKKFAKYLILNLLWNVMGRKNLVRFARFLYDGSRLDIDNDMRTNGEIIVQKNVIINCRNNPICVFDVGANLGSWTRSLAMIAKHSGTAFTVHAFEPCRSTYKTLESNLSRWNIGDHIITQQIALSSTVGRCSFYSIGSGAGINGFYPTDNPEKQTVEEVSTDTIDNYCETNNISHIDIIKIDTEGHDMEVLLGAKKMLSLSAVDFIQYEYNHRWINARHFLKDAFNYLLPLGYCIGKVTPKGIEFYSEWNYELESFKEANYLVSRTPLKAILPQIKWWNE
jgi:FkbM family methyltransferase